MTAMKRAALAVVACVVACVVLVTLSGSTGPVALLESKGARASPVRTALKETKDESLASAAQARLSRKDSRIFKSMALAAEAKNRATAQEDKQFLAARRAQIELDQRLELLTQRFTAQSQALAYDPSTSSFPPSIPPPVVSLLSAPAAQRPPFPGVGR